jgi:hypothetical protein
MAQNRTEFEDALRSLINRYSIENESDTPDFILASYLCRCLDVFAVAIKARDIWYKPDPDKVGQRDGG